MKSTLLYFSILLLFSACGPTEKQTDPESTQEISKKEQPFEMVHIQHEGFALNIAIPDDYKGDNPLRVEMNEAFGQLEIQSGEVFNINVVEEKGGIQKLLGRLESEMVFEYQLIEENQTGVLYRQYIPGEEQEDFWHFYFSFQSNGTDYVIEDASMSELNEYQSRMIFNALNHAVQQGNDSSPS